MSERVAKLGLFAGLLLALAALWFVGRRSFENFEARSPRFAPAPLTDLDPRFIPIFTFNQKNVYDNVIHIWLLQALLTPEAREHPEELTRIVKGVIRQRPRIESLYMLSCFIMMQEFKRPELCQEIILAGLEVFPESWRLPMTQGFVHAFVLKEPASAANFYFLAASRPKSPPYVANVARKLAASEEMTEEDYQKSLEIMLGSEHNERFRAFIKQHSAPAANGVQSDGDIKQ